MITISITIIITIINQSRVSENFGSRSKMQPISDSWQVRTLVRPPRERGAGTSAPRAHRIKKVTHRDF